MEWKGRICEGKGCRYDDMYVTNFLYFEVTYWKIFSAILRKSLSLYMASPHSVIIVAT